MMVRVSLEYALGWIVLFQERSVEETDCLACWQQKSMTEGVGQKQK